MQKCNCLLTRGYNTHLEDFHQMAANHLAKCRVIIHYQYFFLYIFLFVKGLYNPFKFIHIYRLIKPWIGAQLRQEFHHIMMKGYFTNNNNFTPLCPQVFNDVYQFLLFTFAEQHSLTQMEHKHRRVIYILIHIPRAGYCRIYSIAHILQPLNNSLHSDGLTKIE